MNDPHVERLHYRIETPDDVTFDRPEQLVWETPVAAITLSDGAAVAQMLQHYATEQEARAVVEPFLRGYEIMAALRGGGRPEMQFRFVRADIVDREPLPPGEASRVLHAETGHVAVAGMEVSFHVTRRRYPEPPARFTTTPDVEVLWRRYQTYRRGNESLTSMAYFCLTVIEASVGPPHETQRRRAASQYSIEMEVLARLGYLTSEVGDEETARKWHRRVNRPHTGAERAWMEGVVLKLIQRLGEYAADPAAPLAPITMADLPQL